MDASSENSDLKKENQKLMMELVATEKRRIELETHSSFALKLTGRQSFDQTIEEIFGYVALNFQIEASILFLFDAKASEFYHYRSQLPKHIPDKDTQFIRDARLSMGETAGILASACRRTRPFYLPHIRASAHPFDNRVVTVLGLTSLLIVPLYTSDGVFGAIEFTNYTKPLKLSKEDIEGIAAFSAHIAGAVRSSMLVREAREASARAFEAQRQAQKSKRELEKLTDISREINIANNLDTVLDRVFQFIETHYNIEGIWLQFIDEQADELYTYKCTKPTNVTPDQLGFIRSLRVPLNKSGGFIYRVYERRKPFYMARPPQRFGTKLDQEITERLQIRSFLFVPLLVGSEVIAVISFMRYGHRMQLSTQDIESIVRFCDQIAGAINNSHLHTETEYSRLIAEKTLQEVQALKQQQDLDYFLTSKLIEPLTTIDVHGDRVRVEARTLQKKSFPFRRWNCEIGGDICLACTIELLGKPFTVIMNADAMGKSLQGAGGVLVLGSAFRILVDRAASTRYQFPEQWIKNTYEELHSIFKTFEGTMYVSAFLGLVDHSSGLMYFVNADHPRPVIYSKGNVRFLTTRFQIPKLGFKLGKGNPGVDLVQLENEDSVIVASDGRDDIQLPGTVAGSAGSMNEDDDLFLRHVEDSDANLSTIVERIQNSGTITDDLSLLKATFVVRKATRRSSPLLRDCEEAEQKAEAFVKIEDPRAVVRLIKALCKKIITSGFPAPAQERVVYDRLAILICRAWMSLEEPEKALDFAREYTTKQPGCTEILLLIADCARAVGSLHEAANVGERVILRQPESIRALFGLAETWIALRNRDRAMILLERMRELDPAAPELMKTEAGLEAM